ncbi:condensation domain-containing protein, partial [Pseudonocardia lutea]
MDTVTAGAGRRAALVPEPSPEQLRHRQRDEREGPSAADDLVVVLRLRGVLDPEALTAAWRDVLERHPVLRSVYPGPAAEAHVLPAVAVARVRRRPVAPGTGEDVVARVLAAPADLAGEGPARATLLRVAPEEHLLVLAVHRIAIDDRSVRPLLADLAEAYSARRAGRRPLFTAVPAFAAWAEGRGGPAVVPPREQCTGPVPPAGTRRIVVERSLADAVAARLAALRAQAGEPP